MKRAFELCVKLAIWKRFALSNFTFWMQGVFMYTWTNIYNIILSRLCKPFNRLGNNLLFGHASPTYYNRFQELYNETKISMFWKVWARFDPLIIPTLNMRDSRETQFSNGNFMLGISRIASLWTRYLHFHSFRSKCNSQNLWQVLNLHLAHLLLHSQDWLWAKKRWRPWQMLKH